MSSDQLSVPDQIRQLEGARKLVLDNVSYYPQVIQATLPIIGTSSQVEFRRWGADFLSEAFASPMVPLKDKETSSLLVLETFKHLLDDPSQDIIVLRSAIQAAASIYPLAMRWIINNPYDPATWERMTAIKSRILQIWGTAPPTVRICCVKFIQRVVLAQTPSINPEPRRGDPLDISLIMVPPDHPILQTQSLEPEAFGLLDRMLGCLQEHSSDALVIDSVLNTLAILIRMRPSTASQIMNAVLSFNPLKLANSPLTPKSKVLIRSMEKTTRSLLVHISRRDPQNPQNHRIASYLDRVVRSRNEIFDEMSRKRAPPEQANVMDPKRQKTALRTTHPQVNITPLPPGPCTLADVFSLTDNPGIKAFNAAAMVPADLAAKVSVHAVSRIDPEILELAISGVRSRLGILHESAKQPLNPETAPLDVDDDDDYEPDFYAAEDTEQILNKLDSSPTDEHREPNAALDSLALPTFKLPPPPTLNPEQAAKAGQGSVSRVFGTMRSVEDPAVKKTKGGMHRLAAGTFDRESWITVITRLATRASAGLDDITVKDENMPVSHAGPGLSTTIREMLYTYVLEDFRRRIDVAVSWLNEEWYNDRVQQKATASAETPRDVSVHYEKWVLRLLDGFFPYLHAQDKVLTRYLSELPELTAPMLSRVKTLCRDPSLVNLALTSLYYLVMMRPPVRDLALDTVQDIWLEYEDSRPMAAKYLQRWRPAFLEAQKQQEGAGASPSANGTPIAT